MTAPDDHRRQLEVHFRPNLFSEITSLIVSSKPQRERDREEKKRINNRKRETQGERKGNSKIQNRDDEKSS